MMELASESLLWPLGGGGTSICTKRIGAFSFLLVPDNISNWLCSTEDVELIGYPFSVPAGKPYLTMKMLYDVFLMMYRTYLLVRRTVRRINNLEK